MNTPVNCVRRKTMGEVRTYEDPAGLFSGQRPKSWPISFRANQASRRGVRKLPESARHDSNSRVIWGIPVYSKLGA